MHTSAADCSRQPVTGTLLEEYTQRMQSVPTTILHRNFFRNSTGSVPLDPLLAQTTQQNKPNATPRPGQSSQSPGLNLLRDLNITYLAAELENNRITYATDSTTILQQPNLWTPKQDRGSRSPRSQFSAVTEGVRSLDSAVVVSAHWPEGASREAGLGEAAAV